MSESNLIALCSEILYPKTKTSRKTGEWWHFLAIIQDKGRHRTLIVFSSVLATQATCKAVVMQPRESGGQSWAQAALGSLGFRPSNSLGSET